MSQKDELNALHSRLGRLVHGPIWSDPNLFNQRTALGWRLKGGVSVLACEKSEADEFIRRWHYSGSVVWSSSEHFTVVHDSVTIGALQFGPAMNPQSGARIVAGSTADSWLELNRMAFTDARPENCGSQAIAGALRVLRHTRPSVEWVQSFADERCKKFGAVYQAAGFLYCGEHRAMFYELDGEWFHKSAWGRAAIDKRGWGCGPRLKRFNEHRDRAKPVTFRQFRYIRCLTRQARLNLLLPALSYPKPQHEELSA